VKTLIDFDDAPLFAIPVIDHRGRSVLREGVLVEGPQGWGEFSPALDDPAPVVRRWLTAAVEPGTVGWPDPVRGRVPAAVAVPPTDPARAHAIVSDSGCRTADVAVGGALADDLARVEAVRDALGAQGAIRCDAGGRWDADTAISALAALDRAAGGLEYVERPCGTPEEGAAVRRRLDVRLAVSVGRTEESEHLSLRDVGDVAVLVCGPLGGARRAMRVAETCGLPCVVSSSLETSVGLAAGVAVAGALPELPFACRLGISPLLAGDVVAQGRSLIPRDGFLPVAPTAPAPDRDRLREYAITDSERIARWRELVHSVSALGA
jgi:O-succinylbenzoate synthase